jgi:hypothetical protein
VDFDLIGGFDLCLGVLCIVDFDLIGGFELMLGCLE